MDETSKGWREGWMNGGVGAVAEVCTAREICNEISVRHLSRLDNRRAAAGNALECISLAG